ncbi:Nn.00g091840.m01.CDS01 [Neocucurbitaria sp. VM-36]
MLKKSLRLSSLPTIACLIASTSGFPLVKLPAIPSKTTSKVGSLFINPGGPGGRASGLVAQIGMGAIQAESLLASFDLIGLDPRGVGLSKQIECDMTIYAERVSLFPQSEEEFEQLVDKNRRLGESCRNKFGRLVEHIDTISTAKDHEAVRVALGNEPINFIGLSYDTQLGAQYAALLPDNIRTLALDGVLQHSLWEAANPLTETSFYNLVLTHFFEWASKNDSSALKGQDVEALWTSLLMNATERPIPASSCNGSGIGLGASWEALSLALYNATQGDASALSTSLSDFSTISFIGIMCLDWTHTASFSDMLAKQKMATTYAPFTRGASQMWKAQHACLGWPTDVENPPAKLDIKTEGTVLITQSTADPSTGLPWALGLAEEIENRVLVLREGDGHTSFPLGGKTAQAIVEYLITGKAPEEGLILDA